MGKKDPFRLEKEFFIPSTPDELYAKVITSLKSKRKPGQYREFIIEEEIPPHFIRFRFIDIYNLGDYKRSSSITIKPQENGSKVTISTPRAVNDDLHLYNIWIRDDMLILYEFLNGKASNYVLREIFTEGEVFVDFIFGTIILVLFFGLGLSPFFVLQDNHFLGLLLTAPCLLFVYVMFSGPIATIRTRIRILHAFICSE